MRKALFLLLIPLLIHPCNANAQKIAGNSSKSNFYTPISSGHHFNSTDSTVQSGLDTLSLKSIFYEPLLAGHRPEFVRFNPIAPAIYFMGNDSAMRKIKSIP